MKSRLLERREATKNYEIQASRFFGDALRNIGYVVDLTSSSGTIVAVALMPRRVRSNAMDEGVIRKATQSFHR
jgi:hypothetical protein